MGGKFLPKLNPCGRPIANKYREGKMKRTLKRESKVLEIAEIVGMATSIGWGGFTGRLRSDASGAIGASLRRGSFMVVPNGSWSRWLEVRMDSDWSRQASARWLSPGRTYRPVSTDRFGLRRGYVMGKTNTGRSGQWQVAVGGMQCIVPAGGGQRS